MRDPAIARAAAIAATVGFTALAVFQLLLAAGAPLGEAVVDAGDSPSRGPAT